MNPACFAVTRPDGFIGVEVEAGDQLTPDETRAFVKELLKAADKADRLMRKAWPKKVCTVTYEDSYRFSLGRGQGGGYCLDGYASDELEAWLLKHKITHVNSTFGDKKACPESPRKGIYTRDAYVRWWRTGEGEDL